VSKGAHHTNPNFHSTAAAAAVPQEDGISQETRQQLSAKGHTISVCSSYGRSVFGKGTIITRDKESGVLCGGCDPRGDGCVMGW
jgi:gamma-glutamyltranspeptidase/glutathione hydrolase